MSNDDTNEPTGARLTEAQVALFQQRSDEQQPMNYPSEAHAQGAVTVLRETVRALLADRAALVADAEDAAERETAAMMDSLANLADANQLRRDLAAAEAQVAEVARLQVENTGLRHWRDIGQRAGRKLLAQRNAAEAREAAMRPLVARVAKGVLVDSECPFCWTMLFNSDGPHEADCPTTIARALVATWQTPAAPTPDGGDDDCGGTNGPDCRCAGCWTRINETIQALHAMRDAPTPDAQEGGDDDVC